MSRDFLSDLLGLVIVAAVVGWCEYQQGQKQITRPPASVPGLSLSPGSAGGLSIYRDRSPELAGRIGAILAACGDIVERDREVITTTDEVLRLVERAERLGTTEADAGKLAGLGDAMTARLKAPAILGSTQAPLSPERRAAAAGELRAMGDELRGGK